MSDDTNNNGYNSDNNILMLRIQTSIDECDLHIKRIGDALAKISSYFPITEDVYESFSIDDIQALDQFLYRYTKLQDKIGSSLLKNVMYLIEYADGTTMFIDILNILEKYNVIENAERWNMFRGLRNRLTHEYTNDINLQIKTLNEVYDSYQYILRDFENIKNVIRKYQQNIK